MTWNIFSQIANAGMSSLLNMGAMLQKVYIPSWIPAISSGLSIGIERLLEAGVMLAFMLALLNVGWTWVLYPLVLVVVAVFAMSLGYILSVSIVYLRDTGQIFAIFTQLWFFLTPIMYPLDLIPTEWHGVPLRDLFLLNPMTSFVGMSRSLVYELSLPSLGAVLYSLGWTAATVLAARLVYKRWGRDVSEAI